MKLRQLVLWVLLGHLILFSLGVPPIWGTNVPPNRFFVLVGLHVAFFIYYFVKTEQERMEQWLRDNPGKGRYFGH